MVNHHITLKKSVRPNLLWSNGQMDEARNISDHSKTTSNQIEPSRAAAAPCGNCCWCIGLDSNGRCHECKGSVL